MQDPSNRRCGRLRDWLLRYAPLEAAALATALGAGLAVSEFANGQLAIGYAGAWGENIGYYLTAFARERRVRGSSALALRDLLLEFGVAEAVDSLVVRPLCMAFGVGQLGNPAAGIVIGKLAADVPFYGFAILGYELRKKLRP